MHDCKGQRNKDIHYGDARDIFVDAIFFSKTLGLYEESDKLSARLDHLKETYNRYFNNC